MSSTPKLVTNKRFRSEVRNLLVVLHQTVPGLGVVSDEEHVVMLFPRAGQPVESEQDLLKFVWFRVDKNFLFRSFKPKTVLDLFKK